jgi:hypothetical protein
MDKLTRSALRALDAIPGSDRQKALAAGVQPSTITRLRSGERPATPDTARRIEAALRQWLREDAVARRRGEAAGRALRVEIDRHTEE